MKNIEKIVLIIAIILVVFALALYFITFGDGTFSDSKAEWGSFGMYFSGLLTPLFLLIIIFLIFNVMKQVREISSESTKIEKKFQRQFKKQTTYMEPSADVVYYLQMKDDRLYSIVENIGNQPAFNITIEFEFEDEVDERISNNLIPLAEISYLAPEQKSGAVCGVIDESGGYAISEHTVRMKYKPSEKSRRIIKKEFVIDKNILNTLVPEKSVEESIQNLTENIKDLEHKIQDNEESEEKEKVTKTVITEPEPEDDLSIRRPEKVMVTEEYSEPDEEPEEEPEEEPIDIEEPEEEAEIIEEAPEGEEILPPESEEEPVEPEPEEKEQKKEEEEKTEEKEEKEEKKPLKRDNFDNPFLDDF